MTCLDNDDDLILPSSGDSRPNRLGPKAQERLEWLKDEMEHRWALGSRYWNPHSEELAQSPNS
jgi:hypothetical protein